MIEITEELAGPRIAATRDALDTGTAHATLEIYGGTRASSTATAPDAPALVVITFAKPCGTIDGGVLTLIQNDAINGDLVLNTGTATWGRLRNGAGTTMGDGNVTDSSGTGDFKLSGTSGTQLYAGGTQLLGVATLS